MTMITGGCLCRRVRWEATGEPAFSGTCHCRNCQRYTGSAFNAFAVFPADNVKVTGELRTYDDQSDSGQPVHRRFCPNCGSGVASELALLPGMTVLLAGGFDDPSQFTPGMELFLSSAQPWLQAGGERKRFDKMAI
jgi:hypothetical protein